MTWIRRRAVWLVASVLLAQLGVFAATATLGLCCERAGAKKAAVMDCCKGKAHSCPLMKKVALPDANSAMSSCPGADESLASLLFTGRGVLTGVRSVHAPFSVTTIDIADQSSVTRFASIETPPPRA